MSQDILRNICNLFFLTRDNYGQPVSEFKFNRYCLHWNNICDIVWRKSRTVGWVLYMYRSLFSQDIETRLLQACYVNFFESFVAATYRDFIWKLPQNDHWLHLRRCWKDIPFITFVCLVITLKYTFSVTKYSSEKMSNKRFEYNYIKSPRLFYCNTWCDYIRTTHFSKRIF